MSANNSQIGYSPSEPLIINNANESNIDQLLSVDLGTTNQTIRQLTTANIIGNQTSLIPIPPQYDNVIRPQHARRGARHQQQHALPRQQDQQQHRRQHEQQQLQQQQQQRRLQRQQVNNRRYEQWLERRRQREEQPRQYEERRPTTSNDRSQYHNSYVDRTDRMTYRLHLEDKAQRSAREDYEQQQVNQMEQLAAQQQLALIQDEIEQMNQIDAFEKMDEQEKIQQEQWEQENLNEFQGLIVPEPLSFIQDEIEQINQIDIVAAINEEEHQQQRNNEDVLQLEQLEKWENVAFLVQQLNQNETNHPTCPIIDC